MLLRPFPAHKTHRNNYDFFVTRCSFNTTFKMMGCWTAPCKVFLFFLLEIESPSKFAPESRLQHPFIYRPRNPLVIIELVLDMANIIAIDQPKISV